MAKKQKYYVVWAGYQTGIFTDWATCEKSVKGFEAAQYKSFDSLKEAEAAFLQKPQVHLYKKSASANANKNISRAAIVWDSISVDAACSGNPGKMEYRGVITKTGEEIFHIGPLDDGTNNVGEFLALVHGLAYLQKLDRPTYPIYSDSRNAIGWVTKKECKTKLERNKRNEKIFDLISRAEKWLHSNQYQNPILKWETEHWGEIPADFGRK